uniref:Interleukin 18-A1 n=2 Tax=Andrias davidianus TaxID=141262 RepID=A0A6C0N696_ANDDA|nr:interleukin 18-A1 [Andrias davidianus]
MSVSKFMVPQWLEDNLWFEEDTELDTDNWSRSSYSEPQMKILQNYLNLVLVAYPEQKHGCIARYESTLISPERGTFSLHYYRDNHPKHGMPVLFTVKVDNKKYLMYCATNGTVQFREEDAPKYIQGTTCEFIFYKKQFQPGVSNAFKFESSLEEGLYLAFEKYGNFSKLILKKVVMDEIDETIKIKEGEAIVKIQ